jgi:hypothetical protein
MNFEHSPRKKKRKARLTLQKKYKPAPKKRTTTSKKGPKDPNILTDEEWDAMARVGHFKRA